MLVHHAIAWQRKWSRGGVDLASDYFSLNSKVALERNRKLVGNCGVRDCSNCYIQQRTTCLASLQMSPLKFILSTADSFQFDAFHLDTLSQGHPLAVLAYHCISSTGLMKRLKIKGDILCRWTFSAHEFAVVGAVAQVSAVTKSCRDMPRRMTCRFGHPDRSTSFS